MKYRLFAFHAEMEKPIQRFSNDRKQIEKEVMDLFTALPVGGVIEVFEVKEVVDKRFVVRECAEKGKEGIKELVQVEFDYLARSSWV